MEYNLTTYKKSCHNVKQEMTLKWATGTYPKTVSNTAPDFTKSDCNWILKL